MKTGAMFPLGRAEYNPDLHTLIDVPKTETLEEPKVEKPKPKAKKATPKKKSSEKVKKNGNNKSNGSNNS